MASEKKYLITGASRGIGRAIALRQASDSIHLFLHGRDETALQQTASMSQELGAKVELLVSDFSDSNNILSFCDKIKCIKFDMIVHNAGIAVVNPLEEIKFTEWNKIFSVNVTAPFLITQKLLPSLNSESSIVHILSIASKSGFPGWSAYCMSKFALEGFSLSIREELRERGIRVINIYPAATGTDIWKSVEGDWPIENMMSPKEVAEAVAFATERPSSVLVENITIGNVAGQL